MSNDHEVTKVFITPWLKYAILAMTIIFGGWAAAHLFL